MIIEQTYRFLKSRYKNKIENLTISDVRIGLFLTAVRLSDDSYGIASTLAESHPDCTKGKRDFSDFTPLKIKGQKVCSLFETYKESDTIFTLKTAVLNAISSKMISSGNYKVFENCDPIDLIDLNSQKTITIVGAFHSYIGKIAETENRLFVLEINENALPVGGRRWIAPGAVAVFAFELGAERRLPERLSRPVEREQRVLPFHRRGDVDAPVPDDRRRATLARQRNFPQQMRFRVPFHRIPAGVGAAVVARPAPARPVGIAFRRRKVAGEKYHRCQKKMFHYEHPACDSIWSQR